MKSWDEKLEDIDRHLADDTLSNGEYVILSVLRDVMEELAGIGSTVLTMQDELLELDDICPECREELKRGETG
jgi:hypothetical protein